MKFVLLICSFIIVCISSPASYASRDINADEYHQLLDEIENNSSLAHIFRLISTNEIKPFYSLATWNSLESLPGQSGFASSLISHRLAGYSTIGDRKENLKFLELLMGKGVDPNISQGDNSGYRGSLVELAADRCSLDALKILERSGGDLSLRPTSKYGPGGGAAPWTLTVHSYIDINNDKMQESCKETMKYLFSKVKSLEISDVSSLFITGYNYAYEGVNMSEVAPVELRNFLLDKLNFKFSPKPEGDEIGEDEELFAPNLSYDINEIGYKVKLLALWNSASETNKKWSCYYSTIDELYEVLTKSFGWTDADFNWNSFFIETYVPYCESLKKITGNQNNNSFRPISDSKSIKDAIRDGVLIETAIDSSFKHNANSVNSWTSYRGNDGFSNFEIDLKNTNGNIVKIQKGTKLSIKNITNSANGIQKSFDVMTGNPDIDKYSPRGIITFSNKDETIGDYAQRINHNVKFFENN